MRLVIGPQKYLFTSEGKAPPKITLIVDDEQGLYRSEIQGFVAACRDSGAEIEVKHPQKAPFQMAGPAVAIQLNIDPQTLRLLFEYAAALIAIYKGTDYFGAFFKACVSKLGELAGSKLAEAFSTLWHGIYNRVRTLGAAGEQTRVYSGLNTSISGTSVEISNAVFPSHIEDWSEEDDTHAFWLLVLVVLPVMREFADALHQHGIEAKTLKADVWYRKDWFGYWFWRIQVDPIGAFVVGPDAQLKTQYDLKFAKKRRLEPIEIHDIKAIVAAYVKYSQPRA